MNRVQRHVSVILLILCTAFPAQAVRSPSETNLEEINHHQAGAAAALLMGDHTLLEQGRIAVSGHVHVSGWGADGFYGAWGLSAQKNLSEKFGLGLAYGYTDAQLHTRAWVLDVQYSPLSGPTPWLHLQAAVGHQALVSSESENVMIFEFDNPWPIRDGNPEILLDDMTWTHGYLNALVNVPVWKFRPQASLGYVHSHYSWSGWEMVVSGQEIVKGPALEDSDDIGTWTGSLGLGLDLGPVRPYAGIGAFSGSGLFLARMTVVF
ncbi:MAG: hypothetical protein ABFS42_04265 [Candidatus Krumholzibacteriota bacterium]